MSLFMPVIFRWKDLFRSYHDFSNPDHSYLLTYEHVSTVPGAYLNYKLNTTRNLSLEAVKGNCYQQQEVSAEQPFESIWFDLAIVKGPEGTTFNCFSSIFIGRYKS